MKIILPLWSVKSISSPDKVVSGFRNRLFRLRRTRRRREICRPSAFEGSPPSADSGQESFPHHHSMDSLTQEIVARLPESPGVYVLLCRNGQHYTGAARNLRERLRDHRAGRALRTCNQRPLMLVHLACCENYSAALVREKYLKSGQGREWLSQQTVSPPANPP